MTFTPVPDYFQEETAEALRQQVAWWLREVGADDAFFAQLLRMTEGRFSAWRTAQVPLTSEHEQTLRDFWRLTLHLLSFLNCEPNRLRDLLQQSLPIQLGKPSSGTPPWSGVTLREYLATGGTHAMDLVERWVTGLRFGDLYAV